MKTIELPAPPIGFQWQRLFRRLLGALVLVAASPAFGQALDYTIDAVSPEPFSPAEIRISDGSDTRIPHTDLGVAFGEDVNAFSYGDAEIELLGLYNVVRMAYSVDAASVGAGAPIAQQVLLDGAAGDKFGVDFVQFRGNIRVLRGPYLISNAPIHNLTPQPGQSELDGLARRIVSTGLYPLYVTFPPGGARDPATVYIVRNPGGPPEVFATSADMGLVAGDVIDALSVGTNPTGLPRPQGLGPEVLIWISLARGSPTRAVAEARGGDGVLQVYPTAPKVVVDASSLGISSTDEIDAHTGLDPGEIPDCVVTVTDDQDDGTANGLGLGKALEKVPPEGYLGKIITIDPALTGQVFNISIARNLVDSGGGVYVDGRGLGNRINGAANPAALSFQPGGTIGFFGFSGSHLDVQNVMFAADTSDNVTLENVTLTDGAVGTGLGGDLALRNVNMENGTLFGDGIRIESGAGVTLAGNTVLDNAIFAVPGNGTTTIVNFVAGPGGVATVEGEGEIQMGGPFANITTDGVNTEVFLNICLTGTGRFGANKGDLTIGPDGTVIASGTGGTLRLEGGPGDIWTVQGEIGAEGSAVLFISAQNFAMGAGSRCRVAENSQLNSSFSTFIGPCRYETFGNGIFNFDNVTIDGGDGMAIIAATIRSQNNNTIFNNVEFRDAVVSLNPAGAATIRIGSYSGPVQFVLMRQDHRLQNVPGSNLNLQPGTVVSGDCRISGLANLDGPINSTGPNSRIDPVAAGLAINAGGGLFARNPGAGITITNSVINAGSIEAGAGNAIQVQGSHTDSGNLIVGADGIFSLTSNLTATPNSVMRLGGPGPIPAVVAAGGPVSLAGLVLPGSSTSAVQFGGPVAAGIAATGPASLAASVLLGSSPGAAEFTGDVTLEPEARLEIEIGGGGAAGETFDHLQVGGDLVLGGTLRPRLINGYIPAPGETFAVIECDGEMTGSFAAIDQPFASLGTFNVVYDEAQDRVMLSFSVTGTPDFPDFQRLWFSDAEIADGNADATADSEADGLSTFLEWIFGLNPVLADGGAGAVHIERVGGMLELTFRRSTLLPASVQMAVESTTDFAAWPAIPLADYTVLPGDPIPGESNVESVTIQITNPDLALPPGRFFRLRFTEL